MGTRDIGNAKLYKLNMKNLLVLKLVDIFDCVVVEPLKQEKVVLKQSR